MKRVRFRTIRGLHELPRVPSAPLRAALNRARSVEPVNYDDVGVQRLSVANLSSERPTPLARDVARANLNLALWKPSPFTPRVLRSSLGTSSGHASSCPIRSTTRKFHSTPPTKDVFFVAFPAIKAQLLNLTRICLVVLPFVYRYRYVVAFSSHRYMTDHSPVYVGSGRNVRTTIAIGIFRDKVDRYTTL